MSDPRYSSASSPSSNSRHRSASGHPEEASDLTWLDFLRTAGGTVPDHRSEAADRRRRHTGSVLQRRSYPYPAHTAISALNRRLSGASGEGTAAGGGRHPGFDYLSPLRPRPMMPWRASGGDESTESGRRRESDIVLPKWQPDSEVSHCPVCNMEFTFWYRKHHCRKCGRVVCAACSPHRITIPRQYIVQPPNPFEEELGLTDMESPVSRALGGGEVVRVCKPCVPDPWTPETGARGGEGNDVPPRPLTDNARTSEELSTRERAERYRYIPPGPGSGGRSRSQSYHPSAAPFSRSVPGQGVSRPASAFRDAQTRIPVVPPPSSSSRPYGHRYSQSSNAVPAPIPTSRDRPPIPTPSFGPLQPQPRRQVREEDECPVCGAELPPGEQLREAHIRDCIATRFSSSTTSHHPVDSSPSEDVTSGSTPPSSRPRATSYRPRGMALYRATEKDCVTEDGEAQECVICFEEFQPGDEMGRMECLCKFHRHCIRQWWDTKGAGSCPTHQLHE